MTQDEAEIRALIATWMTATQAGDTETVLDLMTEDVIFMVPGKPPFGKAAFAEAARAQADAALKFEGESEILELQVTRDWAYARTRLTVTAQRPGAAPVVRRGHTLSILRKENGRWRLARDANLLGAPEGPEEDG